MPAPSSTSSAELARELNEYLRRNASVRRQAESQAQAMASANTDSETLLVICEQAQRNMEWYEWLQGLSGLPSYAATVLTPSVTAEQFSADLAALIAALRDTVDEVTRTFPPHGYLQDPPIVDGQRVLAEYTPAQTAALRADLTGIVNAIDP